MTWVIRRYVKNSTCRIPTQSTGLFNVSIFYRQMENLQPLAWQPQLKHRSWNVEFRHTLSIHTQFGIIFNNLTFNHLPLKNVDFIINRKEGLSSFKKNRIQKIKLEKFPLIFVIFDTSRGNSFSKRLEITLILNNQGGIPGPRFQGSHLSLSSFEKFDEIF